MCLNKLQIDYEQNEGIAVMLKHRFPEYTYNIITIFTIWLRWISDFDENIEHIQSVSDIVETEYNIIECIFKYSDLIQYAFFGISSMINPVTTIDITGLIVYNKQLGSGTFGKILAGKINGENVAVKLFYNIKKKEIYKQYNDWCVFMKEYAMLSRLQNTGVVGKLYGARWGSSYWQMVVERHYIHSLDWKLHDMNTTERTIQIVDDIFAAINTIHEVTGHIHGDIKPQNIMIDILEGEPVVKIIDFGLSEKIHILHKNHEYIQTIYWRSPELLEHLPSDLVLADAWATAIAVFDIMAGRFVIYDIGATVDITEYDMLTLLQCQCLNRDTIPDEWCEYIEPELIDYANEIYAKYIVEAKSRTGFKSSA